MVRGLLWPWLGMWRPGPGIRRAGRHVGTISGWAGGLWAGPLLLFANLLVHCDHLHVSGPCSHTSDQPRTFSNDGVRKPVPPVGEIDDMEATSPEATSPYPPENLAELRRRMVTAALRHGVGWDDVEDVVQEALAKLLREQPRRGAPPVQIRAFAALRDKRVEFMRVQARERKRRVQGAPAGPGADDEGRGVDIPQEDARLALVEACQLVCGIAGYDAMCFAALKGLGATERDVSEFMGWSAQRVAAARVRLARKKATITQALLETLTPREESW